MQRFQNKVLFEIVNAFWYITTAIIHADLKITTIRVKNDKN